MQCLIKVLVGGLSQRHILSMYTFTFDYAKMLSQLHRVLGEDAKKIVHVPLFVNNLCTRTICKFSSRT